MPMSSVHSWAWGLWPVNPNWFKMWNEKREIKTLILISAFALHKNYICIVFMYIYIHICILNIDHISWVNVYMYSGLGEHIVWSCQQYYLIELECLWSGQLMRCGQSCAWGNMRFQLLTFNFYLLPFFLFNC